jgi:hypothetical protein
MADTLPGWELVWTADNGDRFVAWHTKEGIPFEVLQQFASATLQPYDGAAVAKLLQNGGNSDA